MVKCDRCKKTKAEERSAIFKIGIFSPFYCKCDAADASESDLTDKTVKTHPVAPEYESEYFDTELNARYQIVSYLGSGGGGIIYRVTNRETGDDIVLKLIKQNLTGHAKERFELEAQACSVIEHPNVVGVLEYGVTETGVHYIVMPYIEGTSLKTLIQNKELNRARDVIKVFLQICSGLEASHKAGIVHRDMKPENIIVDSRNLQVSIIDFGIAKVMPTGGEIQGLTQTGEVFGTPAYMSPEQCSGTHVDDRIDIYALGCMLYEAFVGLPPYRAENTFMTLNQHMNADLPPVPVTRTVEDIPDGLEAVIHKCMAKDPDQRYQSIEELATALESLKVKNLFWHKLKSGMTSSKILAPTAVLALLFLCGIALSMYVSIDKSEHREIGPDQKKFISALQSAVRAINTSNSKEAIKITNSILTKLNYGGWIDKTLKPTNQLKNSDDPLYGVILKEALFVRGHAYSMNPDTVDRAQRDFNQCIKMAANDPYFNAGMAYTKILDKDLKQAENFLGKLTPTSARLRQSLKSPPGFNDNWNVPNIYERIASKEQEIVYENIIEVQANNRKWTPVNGINIEPGHKLWIDVRDDSIWAVGLKLPTGGERWTNANGWFQRKVYEENIQSLIAMIGSNHSFFVGQHLWDSIPPGTGRLKFICNDAPKDERGSMPPEGMKSINGDNLGKMTIRVIITKPISRESISGWQNPDVHKKIAQAHQKEVFETILTVDSRNYRWTEVPYPIKANQRLWIDCKKGEFWEFQNADENGMSKDGYVRTNANGHKNPIHKIHGGPVGSLMGTIGDGPEQFFVGMSRTDMAPPNPGNLKLIYNDRNDKPRIDPKGPEKKYFLDNKGFATVRIIVTEPAG